MVSLKNTKSALESRKKFDAVAFSLVAIIWAVGIGICVKEIILTYNISTVFLFPIQTIPIFFGIIAGILGYLWGFRISDISKNKRIIILAVLLFFILLLYVLKVLW